MLTWAMLGELLRPHGIERNDVKSLELDLVRRGDPGSPIVLVVTTYARGDTGHRYIDNRTQEAAIEIQRVQVNAIGLAPFHDVAQAVAG